MADNYLAKKKKKADNCGPKLNFLHIILDYIKFYFSFFFLNRDQTIKLYKI